MVLYCKFCGSLIEEGSSFCGSCGNSCSALPENRPEVVYDLITENEGERICSSCGKPIPEGFRFCGACGHKYEEPHAVRIPHCVLCGAPLTPSARFCTQCKQEYAPSDEGYIELPTEALCPGCGAEIVEGTDFCVQCGMPIADSVPKTVKVVPLCRKCRQPIDTAFSFCSSCGQPIKNTPIYENGMIKCPVCGKGDQPPTRKRCFYCGTVFELPKLGYR